MRTRCASPCNMEALIRVSLAVCGWPQVRLAPLGRESPFLLTALESMLRRSDTERFKRDASCMPFHGSRWGDIGLDMLCVYAPAKISEAQAVYDKREKTWQALEKALDALPQRSLLCIAGILTLILYRHRGMSG